MPLISLTSLGPNQKPAEAASTIEPAPAVLPPDAPESNPVLASSQSTPKRGRKARADTLPLPLGVTHTVQYEKISVQYGATLNLGNFNNCRIDVQFQASVNGDVDLAYKEILERCKRALLQEADNVRAGMGADKPK